MLQSSEWFPPTAEVYLLSDSVLGPTGSGGGDGRKLVKP